jgi:hypothetical protein
LLLLLLLLLLALSLFGDDPLFIFKKTLAQLVQYLPFGLLGVVWLY